MSAKEANYFSRTALLCGADVMERLRAVRVIIFGVGGVGSWCAEALVRTGLLHLTIVDADRVAASNVNRQLMALPATVGRFKVEVLRERLLAINPDADICVRAEVYDETTADGFDLSAFHYVIDAIDSLAAKALLIRRACEVEGGTLFSSMGAARRLDATRVSVAEFWKVRGCPLAAALRRYFKRSGQLPHRRFKCVFSDEPAHELSGEAPAPHPQLGPRRISGSLVHVTGTFGFALAGLVVQDLCERAERA